MTRMTIYKYLLMITDEQLLTVPEGAAVLHVGEQDGELCVWCLIDPKAPNVQKMVRIYGTGNPYDGDLEQFHVGSVQIGPFVWHVFWEMA